MKNPMKDLSVIIVSWNTQELLDQCLRSVFETTSELDFEVVVVDNASSDASADMVESKYPQVRLIRNDANVGFAKANNQACEGADARYYLLLNSDTIVHDGALKLLVDYMDSHDRCGVCGPMLLNGDGTLQPSWARLPSVWDDVAGVMDRSVGGKKYDDLTPAALADAPPFAVGWIGGACFLVRRAAADVVGLMDEEYFMYSEETDWCWRISRAGYTIDYVPQARVVHLGGQSSKKASLATQIMLQRSKIRLARKRFGAVAMVPIIIAAYARILKAYISNIGGGKGVKI